MGIYEELVARGLIAQVTDEDRIKDLVNNGKATFYIGFDPTADSLHVGHFMALCLMKRLQEAGNKPIALIGGGTAMIGDPSGRTDMRQMMTKETIQHNIDCRRNAQIIQRTPGVSYCAQDSGRHVVKQVKQRAGKVNLQVNDRVFYHVFRCPHPI